jgi:hypothetical protein
MKNHRAFGQRYGPLPYWLTAFGVVASPVLGASQADSQFSQDGSKLVGTFAAGLGEQGWSVALSADGTGPSWARSWSAPTRSKVLAKAGLLRCLPTALPLSWVGLATRSRTETANCT